MRMVHNIWVLTLLSSSVLVSAFFPNPASGPRVRTSAAQHTPNPEVNDVVAERPAPERTFLSPKMCSFYGEERRRLQELEQQDQHKWAKLFNELLVTQGEGVCVAGYEGYIRHGSKGAVAVYHDDSTPIDSQALSYTTLEELLNDERMNDDIRGQLTERVTSYDPDFEVAVLFAYNGQVGLNVIRPQYPPKFIFELTRNPKK